MPTEVYRKRQDVSSTAFEAAFFHPAFGFLSRAALGRVCSFDRRAGAALGLTRPGKCRL